jgi:hypothetical protein
LGTLTFILTLFTSKKLYAQLNQEEILIKSVIELCEIDKYDDTIHYKNVVTNFNFLLMETFTNYNISNFNKLKKLSDSLPFNYNITKSELGNFELFRFAINSDNWNYIKENKKVILRQEETFDYYLEVHNLTNNSFLLIKRMDEMSFCCYDAYVYNKRIKLHGNKVLTVCSWTNLDGTYPIKDTLTGIYKIEGGMEYYKPLAIKYHWKTKTISYNFTRQKDGKSVKRSAKYKNGKFIIKSYDARTFDE